jgi:hypothetical protein
MKKAIHTFPTVNALSCVWIETGNSRRPLARLWMDVKITLLAHGAPAESEVDGIRLCA